MSSSDIFNDDELERLRNLLSGRARFTEVERLRAEVATLKALLREALVHLDDTWGAGELCNTIRAALGDEPADDATRKQP